MQLFRWGLILTLTGLCVGACLIPDRDLDVQITDENPGAVRVVERPPLAAELIEICDRALDGADIRFCPPVPPSSPRSGLLRPTPRSGAPRDFCLCPSGDNAALSAFEFYAEDPDRIADDPKDILYGVLMLDPDRALDDPASARAYGNYLEPCGEGERVDTIDPATRTYPSEGREPPNLWKFRVDDFSLAGVVDLCNNNERRPLTPGLHNLLFVVSDRTFFRAPRRDTTGELVLGPQGNPQYGPTQCGIPDLAKGATFATKSYVFECKDPDTSDTCDCLEARPQ